MKAIIETKDIKQRVTVTLGDVEIYADIDQEHIEIASANGSNNFIFKSGANHKTLMRWKRVLKALTLAVNGAGKILKENKRK